MDTAGSTHVAVCCEADDTTVARAAEENKVRGIRIPIVRRFDGLVAFNLFIAGTAIPSRLIPLLQVFRIALERFEDPDQRIKRVRGYCILWSQRSKDATRTEKRLEIGAELIRKIPDYLMREPLFVSDPLQELRLERVRAAHLTDCFVEQPQLHYCRLPKGKEIDGKYILFWDIVKVNTTLSRKLLLLIQ